ncbi:MAG TPA: SHOCT domain-containing protein [Trueperaceae bacterium]|nr:SHOCT domain-containing protein [Trueperaceae bacterium]
MIHGFGHGAGFGFGLGFLNLIGMVLFFLLVFWVIKALVRGSWRNGPGPRGDGEGSGRPGWWGGPWHRYDGGQDEALQIARARFARGDITLEEFEAVKRALET